MLLSTVGATPVGDVRGSIETDSDSFDNLVDIDWAPHALQPWVL